MVIIIACAIIGLIVGCIIGYEAMFGWDPIMILSGFLGIVVGILVGLAIFGIIFGIGCLCEADMIPVSEETVELVALKDNFGTSHGHYLYRCSVDSSLKYVYMVKIAGKGIANKTISTDDTYMNYVEEGTTPYLTSKTITYKNPVLRFLMGNMYTEYYFYVPQGSIVAEGTYEIDLE